MPISTPTTREFRSLQNNLEYARNLITAGRSLAGINPRGFDVRDLYRAALVQAVSALDHWLHEEIYRRVQVLAADTGPHKPVRLKNLELTLDVVEKIRVHDLTLTDAVESAVKARLGFVALQNPKKIAEHLKLVSDGDLWNKVAAVLNESNFGTTNFGGGYVTEKLSGFVERRNQIAHYADLEDGDLKRRRDIDHAYATDAVDWIGQIGLAVAQVLGPDAPVASA